MITKDRVHTVILMIVVTIMIWISGAIWTNYFDEFQRTNSYIAKIEHDLEKFQKKMDSMEDALVGMEDSMDRYFRSPRQLESTPERVPIEKEPDVQLFPFDPKIKKIRIDVGSNTNPYTPSDETEATIPIEPLLSVVQGYDRNMKNFYPLPIAVGSSVGFLVLNEPDHHASSSLYEANSTRDILVTKHRRMVPVIPLSFLMRIIPKEIEISFLKIDAQGFDIDVLKGAGMEVKRARFVQVEAQTSEAGMKQIGTRKNHIDNHIKYMGSMGFKLVRIHCYDEGRQENRPMEKDVEWYNDMDVYCSLDWNAVFKNENML